MRINHRYNKVIESGNKDRHLDLKTQKHVSQGEIKNSNIDRRALLKSRIEALKNKIK